MSFAPLLTSLAVSSALAFTALAFTALADSPSSAETASSTSSQSSVEDIYVLRSLRDARSTTPSAFCDSTKIGFTAQIEDRYTFKAVATQARDGRVSTRYGKMQAGCKPVLTVSRGLRTPTFTAKVRLRVSTLPAKVNARLLRSTSRNRVLRASAVS